MHLFPIKIIVLISQRLKEFWRTLTGPEDEFSLEARIFHGICIISLFILAISIPLNFVSNLSELTPLISLLLFIGALLFYLSRYQKKLNLSIILFSLLSNFLFVFNFYFNSGIDGPGLMIFMLCLFLTIAIVPKKQYLFWLMLNVLEVIALLIISYKEPLIFEYRYPSTLSRYTDIGSSYVLIAVLIFLVTAYIRNSYNREKKIAKEKALELQISNDTKNKLLSILAHDLRSPLASIQNYLEVLSEFNLDDSEKKTIQAGLLNETKNTQQMLGNLLSWSKTQMEGVTVNLREINLKETLMPALMNQQTLAAEKCIHLEDLINETTVVLADRDMLQLVVRNLVNNAVKFTEAGGYISITSTTKKDRCLIRVKDNGQGIPYEMQEDLFTLKVKSTFGTQNEKGVGLGLALCKEFTEIQNGKIWFESIPGSGTSFFISLAQTSSIPENSAKLSAAPIGKTLLI